MKKLGILVGSLREESYSKKVAEVISKRLENEYEVNFISIGDVPFYNEDLESEGKIPEEWKSLRKEVAESEAFLFVTPEYNRTIPAVLKNALDVASRPYGSSGWDGKPGGVVSVSTGNIGGFGSNHHLRQAMTFLNVYMMQQPEAYISNMPECVDENGVITERTKNYLEKIADALSDWYKRFI